MEVVTMKSALILLEVIVDYLQIRLAMPFKLDTAQFIEGYCIWGFEIVAEYFVNVLECG